MVKNDEIKLRLNQADKTAFKVAAKREKISLSEFLRRAGVERAASAAHARRGLARLRKRFASGLLLVALLGALACDGTPTAVLVSVEAAPGVGPVEQIRATFSNSGMSDVRLFPMAPGTTPIMFPTAFAVTLPSSRTGTLDLALEGLAGGMTVAHGANRAGITKQAVTEVIVRLTLGEPLCGNRQIDPGETCDDGNRASGDGCDLLCQTEAPPADGGADATNPEPSPDGGGRDQAPDAGTPDAGPEHAPDGAAEAPPPDAMVPDSSGKQGEPCVSDGQCDSGFCADGTCCLTRCDEACKSCSITGTGVCVSYGRGTDPEGECAPGACGASGCSGLAPNGSTCSSKGTCASGFCDDGVCCNIACFVDPMTGAGQDKTCWACNLAGSVGKCTKVAAGQTDGDSLEWGHCNAPGVFCDGMGGCNKPPGAPCAHSSACASKKCTSGSNDCQ